MARQRRIGQIRSAEARLWTGPVAHLVGGALDVLGALSAYAFSRIRSRRPGMKRPADARKD